jgi:hypothetical protein
MLARTASAPFRNVFPQSPSPTVVSHAVSAGSASLSLRATALSTALTCWPVDVSLVSPTTAESALLSASNPRLARVMSRFFDGTRVRSPPPRGYLQPQAETPMISPTNSQEKRGSKAAQRKVSVLKSRYHDSCFVSVYPGAAVVASSLCRSRSRSAPVPRLSSEMEKPAMSSDVIS